MAYWDGSVRQIDPVCILDDSDSNNALQKLYSNLPATIVEMISDVIEIGTGNLYGGTSNNSPFSMNPLLKVVEACKMHLISLPDLELFKKSSFEEAHGWGYEREKSFFVL